MTKKTEIITPDASYTKKKNLKAIVTVNAYKILKRIK